MTLSKPAMSAIRFGYGIRPGEAVPDGPDALLAQLQTARAEPLRFPAEGIDGRKAAVAEFFQRLRDAKSEDKAVKRDNLRPIRKQMFHLFGADQHARIVQSAFSPYGFNERLAAFWFDHFSVSARKQKMMNLYVPLYEAEAIRPNMTGSFTALLTSVIHHPAMLIYLDQAKSSGPNSKKGKRGGRGGLNENLGRELLELHTLGVDGGYTQDDVRAAALVLTGLTVDRDTGESRFRRQFAEPGPLTFMGRTYGGEERTVDDIDAMLADIAAMPRTGAHICRKLAVHFVSDTPPQPLVDTMVAAWQGSDGNLGEVYAAMLRHPLAWENPGEKARQPLDFVIAGLRALDVPAAALGMPDRRDADDRDDDARPVGPTPDMMAKPDSRQDMLGADPEMVEDAEEKKQDEEDRKKKRAPLRPPLNGLSVRAVRKLGQPLWEPASPAGFEEGFDAWVSSSQITGRIEWAQRVSARFGSRLDPNDLLKTVLRDDARQDTIAVVRQAPSRAVGVTLVLASPEFNRR